MKWAVYNLLFAVVYPFLLPGFLARMLRRGGYAARFADRFALYPNGLFPSPLQTPKHPNTQTPKHPNAQTLSPIWIHAVSVGEVQVAGQLMREWRAVEPSVRFCFSTTSSTGWKMAEREVGPNDTLIYNPLDFPNFVKSALKTVRPRAVILTESEIWPNFIRQAKKCGIPLFLINARVSDRSAPRYRFARLFFKDVFSCFAKIFAQSDLDRARLVAAGAPAEAVAVTGSFKFDVAHRNPAKEAELRAWLAAHDVADEARILLGGSTWPGEDEVLLEIYKRLLAKEAEGEDGQEGQERREGQEVPAGTKRPLVLVLAPRHFEKADAVEANIQKAGFPCIRRSQSPSPQTSHSPNCQTPKLPNLQTPKHPNLQTPKLPNAQTSLPPVFLADTTGELMGLYGIADVVFVGKSLCAHGSQNMIEPCLCGKPTFVGPYTENFRPVMSDLLATDAIRQVKDAADLEGCLEVWAFGRSGVREGSGFGRLDVRDLGARAQPAVERRRGVVTRCVAEIRERL